MKNIEKLKKLKELYEKYKKFKILFIVIVVIISMTLMLSIYLSYRTNFLIDIALTMNMLEEEERLKEEYKAEELVDLNVKDDEYQQSDSSLCTCGCLTEGGWNYSTGNISISGDGINEIIIPEVVNGKINGSATYLYPQSSWYSNEYLNRGVVKDSNGYYSIAVGPSIILPDYPDTGKIWTSDFPIPTYVKVILKNEKSEEIKILDCIVKDGKAHTFNKYSNGNVNVQYDIKNGIIQTGIAYPNSANAKGIIKGDSAYEPDHADSSVIEFIGTTDFKASDYKLIKLYVSSDINKLNNAQKNGITDNQNDSTQKESFIWPTINSHTGISSPFGNRTNPISGKAELHTGIDIPAPADTPVLATNSGKVTFSGVKGGYGNTIMIDHGNGIVSLYGHNKGLIAVEGQEVKKGEKIALVGSTGNSTGNHIHFEIKKDGKAVDPLEYVSKTSALAEPNTNSGGTNINTSNGGKKSDGTKCLCDPSLGCCSDANNNNIDGPTGEYVSAENAIRTKMEGKSTADLNKMFLGSETKTYFKSSKDADGRIVSIKINTWNFKSGTSGEKVTVERWMDINSLVADEVKSIFDEIYKDNEKFPIKDVGGYAFRPGNETSMHCKGLAIDINYVENYMPGTAGKYWAPIGYDKKYWNGKYPEGGSSYSMSPNGSVAQIFKRYKWYWGGDWKGTKDYMHFSLGYGGKE